MSKSFREIILGPVITEKGTDLLSQNKYVFKVSPQANKIEIRNAVEEVFKVRVKKVRTLRVKGKAKKFRGKVVGKTSSWKKAIVKLKEGESIEELGV